MEFSCHIWAFDDIRLEEALGTIARLGFRYVDIGTGNHFNIASALDNEARKIMFNDFRVYLELFNLKVADVYLFLPRISLDDDKKRNRDILLFKAMLPFAKAFGASGVTVTSGLIHPENDAAAWERMIASLREMQSAANDVELPLSVEPHLDSMVFTIERIERMLSEVKGLQLTLDWAQLFCQGIKDKDIAKLLRNTRHIQIRQAQKNQLQVPYKRGKIDVEQVMSAIQKAKYDDFICVEYMLTEGWHGMQKVNPIVECATMRDALRDARNISIR